MVWPFEPLSFETNSHLLPPQSLPGTNNAGTDALLNSSGGLDASAEKAEGGWPPPFAASLGNRFRQFRSVSVLSLQTKIPFVNQEAKKKKMFTHEMQPDVCLNVHTPDGTAAWSLCSGPWSFIRTPPHHPHGGTPGCRDTCGQASQFHLIHANCMQTRSLTPLLSRPDSTGNSIALIKRLAPTISITQQSILLNERSSTRSHPLLPSFLPPSPPCHMCADNPPYSTEPPKAARCTAMCPPQLWDELIRGEDKHFNYELKRIPFVLCQTALVRCDRCTILQKEPPAGGDGFRSNVLASERSARLT